MQRFKTLVRFLPLILVLLVLTLSVSKSDATPVTGKAILIPKLEHPVVDIKELRLYKQRQEALKVAVMVYFDKAIASGDIVGAGVSIVQGDSIVLSDGFGKRNSSLNDEVTKETIFRLGSLSKGFAGVLAANLKQEGTLDWDDKVHDYIPEFQLGDSANTNNITLAHILSHTSGTPYHSYTNLIEAGVPVATIATRFKDVVPISKPGELYSYQNAMFALCGEIMRKATGQEITTSLANRFFKPLGMHTATMDYETLAHAENVAMPHVKRRNSWKNRPLTNSYFNAIVAGGINASALDMAKWMRFLLGHNPEIMDKSALKAAFNPVIELKENNKYYQRWPGHLTSYYGFGWRIHKFLENDTNLEKTIWHHGGSVNDYRNEIALYPEADLGICVLLNSNSRLARTVIPDLQKIVKAIYDKNQSTDTLIGHATASLPF